MLGSHVKKYARSAGPGILIAGLVAAGFFAPARTSVGTFFAAYAGVCYAYPPCKIYTTEAFGGVHNDGGSPAITNEPTFSMPLARASHHTAADPSSGLVLDAYGGLHVYGNTPLTASNYPYYAGVDIARDFVFDNAGTGGYELDGFSGIHPFALNGGALPAAPVNYPYFAGHDVAIKITLLADGLDGYVLDRFGGIHPWAASGGTLPVAPAQYGYWAGCNCARDIWVDPASTVTSVSGYVIDLYGGFHAFWGGTAAQPEAIVNYPYWTGSDLARSLWVQPGATSAAITGYVLDAYGGIHPFAGAGQTLPPPVFPYGYWSGQDLARVLFGG